MFSLELKRIMRLQRISIGLAGFCFGLLVSVFSNWIYEKGEKAIYILFAVLVVSGLIAVVLYLRHLGGIEVAIRIPLIIRRPTEAQEYARRGFVGFVPLYTPQRGTEADGLSGEERQQAIESLDFDRLQPEKSNLQPTIVAILSHSSRLEHCWLLATSGEEFAGSLPYAHLLAEYLRQRKGLDCQFHYGEEYTISMDDDALMLDKTYKQVRRVFGEATREKIPPPEMVADITTGVRSAALGMILACLDRDRDIEFVGTRYNEKGRPTGRLFPIIFSFEPILEQR